jgi:hypothetical protein
MSINQYIYISIKKILYHTLSPISDRIIEEKLAIKAEFYNFSYMISMCTNLQIYKLSNIVK